MSWRITDQTLEVMGRLPARGLPNRSNIPPVIPSRPTLPMGGIPPVGVAPHYPPPVLPSNFNARPPPTRFVPPPMTQTSGWKEV